MYTYSYNPTTGCIELSRSGAYWFSIPAAVTVNNVVYLPENVETSGDTMKFMTETSVLTMKFLPDSIEASCNVKFSENTPIFEAYYFKTASNGMDMAHFDRAFCTQPRNNSGNNMTYYRELPDCSLNGYFSPPILNFTVGNPQGYVSFGLLDIPDGSKYKLCGDFSLLVESCGGNKVKSDYDLPRLLITFPKDEWDGISLFRQKLIDYGVYTPKKPQLSEVPAWWRDPIICTYGDELATLMLHDADMNAPAFCADWVRKIVSTAEERWGIKHMNIVLDAHWQIRFALDPKVDAARFGNMRDFVEEMHARGHHVLAWITPLFDSIANGFETRSQRLGILSNCAIDPLGVKGSYMIDFTSDNAKEYFRQVMQVLLGSGEGEYNLDGVKMDYIGLLRDPSKNSPYAHPERGIGMRELKLFFEAVYEAKNVVKPDAVINCSTTEPRFEHLIDQNRLHDTHCGSVEKEMRARISTLACPDLLIDSDGALMFADWAKAHYIEAAIYSIPSNYYTFRYEDRELTDFEAAAMGTLLSIAGVKPDGHAIMDDFGSWRLVDDNGQVNGQTISGHIVVYYPWEKSEKGYIFSWQNETVVIPLHGRKFGKFEVVKDCDYPAFIRYPRPTEYYQVDYARDHVLIRLRPGVLYSFESIDEENSLHNIFAKSVASNAGEVNYSH